MYCVWQHFYLGNMIDSIVNISPSIINADLNIVIALPNAKNVANCMRLSKTMEKRTYNIGSRWWFIDGPSFESYPIPRSILITEENKGWYRCDDEWFASKNALIQSQIDYWESLKDKEQ